MALARVPESSPLRDVELTRMRRRHLRRVLSIESRVYPRPWSASLFLSELSQRSTRSYLVARHDGQVVGYAGMMFTGREAHITNIAVDPGVHGRKVGTRLLYALITEAAARDAQVVTLEVRVTNKVAQSMYEKFGFSAVGVRKGYYIETNEDALVMEAREVNSNEFIDRVRTIRKELEAELGGDE
ncbi:MAG: ribosomal protein S18-alanine N-acetyltransferase [Actinomycetota bacterium]